MNIPQFNILLVEDSPGDARLLHEILHGVLGLEQICHVECLEEAIAACGRFSFDVVLLDLSLPDSDGLETLVDLQAAGVRSPVIILTGLEDEQMALASLKLGAQDYLFKGRIDRCLLIKSMRYAVERARIAEQLRQSEEGYRQLVDLCPDAILIATDEQIVFGNSAAVGLLQASSPEDLIGQSILTYVYPEDRAIARRWMEQVSQQGRPAVQIEQRWVIAGDTVINVETTAAPFVYHNQAAQQIVIRDISQRKRLEEGMLLALQHERDLNDLKSNFVSMVSHEFRNPLATIRTFVELFEGYYQDLSEERRSQYFRLIKTEIAHMLHLLDEVLILGQTESGGLRYEPEFVLLGDLCQELVESLKLRVDTTHQVVFQSDDFSAPVEMDAVLLRHILSNLLSNAVKYSPENSKIFFRVFHQERSVIFQVKDQGIGIPPQDYQHLFETFYRASNVGKIQGTGLGLAIVKKCVDLHGGLIQIDSEVGRGTTVTVMLPWREAIAPMPHENSPRE